MVYVRASSIDAIASYHSEDQRLIPANGQCLYATVTMGYLLPIRQEAAKATARIDQLFGQQPAYYLNRLYQTLANPTDYLTCSLPEKNGLTLPREINPLIRKIIWQINFMVAQQLPLRSGEIIQESKEHYSNSGRKVSYQSKNCH